MWHADILRAVKQKPRTLIEMLAREASMTAALIDLGTRRDARAEKRFLKATERTARILGLDSATLQDVMLQTAIDNLGDSGILEDSDMIAPGSPDSGIGGDENRNHRSPDGGGQMTDPGIVPDIQACR